MGVSGEEKGVRGGNVDLDGLELEGLELEEEPEVLELKGLVVEEESDVVGIAGEADALDVDRALFIEDTDPEDTDPEDTDDEFVPL